MTSEHAKQTEPSSMLEFRVSLLGARYDIDKNNGNFLEVVYVETSGVLQSARNPRFGFFFFASNLPSFWTQVCACVRTDHCTCACVCMQRVCTRIIAFASTRLCIPTQVKIVTHVRMCVQFNA